jgi:hypothetical protein
LILFVVLAAGCGQKELPSERTYPVRGTVRLRGEPASYVIIRLEPVEPGKGLAADGFTDADGAFTLRTYSNDEPDGVVPGLYQVILEEYDPVQAGAIPEGAVPTQIKGEFKTNVTVEIKGEESDLPIDIP